MAFAYIALFVGMFIIYNTFSIIIAQRMREMAMLRAIGASRRQVLRAVLFESAIVGMVASAHRPGWPACGMSFGLRALLGAVGLEIPSGDVVITHRHGHHGLRGRHLRDAALVDRPGPPGQPHQARSRRCGTPPSSAPPPR